MKEKLRIGVLSDGDNITAWSYKMLELINNSEHSEIVLIVKKQGASSHNKSFTKKVWDIRKDLAWILYNKLESKLFKPSPNAFETKNIKDLVSCSEITVTPRETKFSDYISNDDVEKIKAHNVDVFVRLGFRILRGGILKASKYGIWSFHHGDNSVNRGGPAGAWEVLESWDETGVILQILSEDLDGGTILSKSYSATDKVSIIRNKNNYYWKALSMLPRKLKALHALGEEAFFNSLDADNSTDFYYNRLFVNPTNFQVLKAFMRIYSHKIKNSFKSLFYFDQWILLYQFNKKGLWSKSFFRFKRITPPRDRFWADPFIVEKNNKYFIFLEELLYKENKGKISVMEIDEKGEYTAPTTILEKDYHLSYPFIFEDNDKMFMIPETAGNKTIELYECKDFPLKWELSKILFENISAVDSTILKHNNKYWLFCNVKENEGASSLDELFLYYSDTLESNNWTSHSSNPIISDVRQARPAGRIFEENGKLYRPSQNCGKDYGYGMKINEIIELTETTYIEKNVQSINPNWDKDLLCTHTLNNVNKLTVIDALIKRRKY
jgi:folate-dependent phosphoribosylglycinamide formyltransferase PurN